jgi:hypothetical protein
LLDLFHYYIFCLPWRNSPSGPRPPHYRGFIIALRLSSGRVTSPTQRPLPDSIQHSQEKHIPALGGIRTHNPRKRAAADPRHRPRGHWDGPLKANSHIACRTHAVPLPCRALFHTCHAAPLPCSDSAVSFVNVRMVAGNIRTASPTESFL